MRVREFKNAADKAAEYARRLEEYNEGTKKEVPSVIIIQCQCDHSHIGNTECDLELHRNDDNIIIVCPICGEIVRNDILSKVARNERATHEAVATKLDGCDPNLHIEIATLLDMFGVLKNEDQQKADPIDFDVESISKPARFANAISASKKAEEKPVGAKSEVESIEYFITMIFGVKLLAARHHCIEKYIDFLSELEMKLRRLEMKLRRM